MPQGKERRGVRLYGTPIRGVTGKVCQHSGVTYNFIPRISSFSTRYPKSIFSNAKPAISIYLITMESSTEFLPLLLLLLQYNKSNKKIPFPPQPALNQTCSFPIKTSTLLIHRVVIPSHLISSHLIPPPPPHPTPRSINQIHYPYPYPLSAYFQLIIQLVS